VLVRCPRCLTVHARDDDAADTPSALAVTKASGCPVCRRASGGATETARAAPSPLPRVAEDTYERREKLGEGGMGTTWLAWDRRLGRLVALKEPRADLGGGELLARFEDEARLTASLQHPAIVNVHEAGYVAAAGDERLFYTMQPIDGRSLEDEIGRRPTLAARLELLPQFIAIANAVAYAHDRGVVHRDLKPANILIGNFGEAVLIDWGLAKAIDSAGAVVASVVSERTWTVAGSGTLLYMAPEQAAGEPAAPSVDVYALGATLFHLIAGTPAYADFEQMQLRIHLIDAKPAPRIAEVVPDVPPALAAIVARAMAPVRAERFGSAKELADELTRFTTGQLVQSYRQSARERALRWLRRHRLAVAATVALLGVGAAATTGLLLVRARARSVDAEHRATQLAMDVGLQADLDRAARLGDRYGAETELAALRTVATRHQGVGLAAAVRQGLVALTMGEQARVIPRRGAAPTLLAPGYLGLADPLTVIRLSDGATVARVDAPDARTAAISGDGRLLVVCAAGSLRRFALPAGTPLADGAPTECVAGAPLRLSATGRILAQAGASGVQLRDLLDGQALADIERARDVIFARDVDVALVEGADGRVRPVRVAANAAVEVEPWFTPVARPRALTPDGAWVAFGTDRQVWMQAPTASAAPILVVGELLDLGPANAYLASPDGGLMVASAPGWQAARVAGPAGEIAQLAVSLNGQTVATRDDDGAVAVWGVAPGRPATLVPVQRVAAAADQIGFVGAAQLALIDDVGARVLDVAAPHHALAHGPVVSLAGHGRTIAALTPRPADAEPSAPCATIAVLDLAGGAERGRIELPPACDPARRMFLDDAGRHVVLATPTGSDVIEVDSGETIRLPAVDVAYISPGGRWLVGATSAGAITPAGYGLYDRVNPQAGPLPLPPITDLDSIKVAFDADDRAAAVVVDGQAWVIDLAGPGATPRVVAGVDVIALAADSAVVAGAGGGVRWFPRLAELGSSDDAEVVTMQTQVSGVVSALAVARTPQPRVAVASVRRVTGAVSISTIELFDAVTGVNLATVETPDPVQRLAFTDAGFLIASAAGHHEVFAAGDGARLLSVAADAISRDLAFVALTAGPSTSVRPLTWPATADLLAPAAQRTNARVCGAMDRVTFALPFATRAEDVACP
jgi:hypothetical protein